MILYSTQTDPKIVATCLDSVIARLPLVREDVRLASSTTISEIVKQTTSIISKLDINADAAIDVLGVITAADVKAEDSVLTQVIPVLLDVASMTQSTDIQISAYELLAVLLCVYLAKVSKLTLVVVNDSVHASFPSSRPSPAILSPCWARQSSRMFLHESLVQPQFWSELCQLSLLLNSCKT